jgi:hypothetical protein
MITLKPLEYLKTCPDVQDYGHHFVPLYYLSSVKTCHIQGPSVMTIIIEHKSYVCVQLSEKNQSKPV